MWNLDFFVLFLFLCEISEVLIFCFWFFFFWFVFIQFYRFGLHDYASKENMSVKKNIDLSFNDSIDYFFIWLNN